MPVRSSNSSKLLLGLGLEVHLVDVDWMPVGQQPVLRSSVPLAKVEEDKTGNRFNDGKADKFGRLWIGKLVTHCEGLFLCCFLYFQKEMIFKS